MTEKRSNPGPGSPAGEGRRFMDRLSKATPIILLACALMMVVCIVLSVTAIRAIDRVEHSEEQACARVQTLRDQVNRHGHILYKMNVRIANIVNDPIGPKAAQSFIVLAGQVDYLRATNCEVAVRDPAGYTAPSSIPWEDYEELLKRIPTPRQDPRLDPAAPLPSPTALPQP